MKLEVVVGVRNSVLRYSSASADSASSWRWTEISIATEPPRTTTCQVWKTADTKGVHRCAGGHDNPHDLQPSRSAALVRKDAPPRIQLYIEVHTAADTRRCERIISV